MKLGYLAEKELPQYFQGSKEFLQALRDASFREPELWTIRYLPGTNGSRWVMHITAYPADFPAWERIVAEFNAKSGK